MNTGHSVLFENKSCAQFYRLWNLQIGSIFASICDVYLDPVGQMRISSIGSSYPECASRMCNASGGVERLYELQDLELNCLFNYPNQNIPVRYEMRACSGEEWCDANCLRSMSCLQGTILSGQNLLNFVQTNLLNSFHIECWAINSYTGNSFRHITPARLVFNLPKMG